MGNTTLSHGGGAKDRFQKAEMAETRKGMNSKRIRLEFQQAELLEKLQTKFDDDTFRKLNVVNQHLQVADSRAKGNGFAATSLKLQQ